jgi:hypothetical protein
VRGDFHFVLSLSLHLTAYATEKLGKESDKGGKILANKRASYPIGPIYSTQEKAWMSEGLMMMWVEQCLAPYVAMAPDGIIPLLFLDSFNVHKMGSVN